MRIFLGLSEITQIENELAHGFRDLGHQTQTVLWERAPFFKHLEYDYIIDEQAGVTSQSGVVSRNLRRYSTVLRHMPDWMKNNDVFVFIFANSLLPFYLDYPLLKAAGKKIISVFCGTDIRYWYAYQQEMRYLGVEETVAPFLNAIIGRSGDRYTKKLRRVRTAEKYADVILAQPSYGQLFVKPYMQLRLPLDLSGYGFNVPDREVPVVLHTPSHRELKGTTQVLETVEQLKKEGLKFEFRLVEKVSNAEIRKLLLDSDIVIDQLISAIIGKMALEGMATGNAVLGRYMPGYIRMPGTCPMISVDKFTLADQLRAVITNRELRRRLAYEGRSYVESYYSHVAVSRDILSWLEPGGITEYDYTPTFFREHFQMDPELKRKEDRDVWNAGLKFITGR